jgi:type II secretory pathway component PulF
MTVILMQNENCLTLWIMTLLLSIVYSVLAFNLILRNYKTFDRFTILLTLFGLFGMLLEMSSALGGWLISRHLAQKD